MGLREHKGRIFLLGLHFKTEMLTLEIVACKLLLVKRDMQLNNFSQFRFVCGVFYFLNHLAPPSKGELMLKAPYFIFICLFICLFFGSQFMLLV